MGFKIHKYIIYVNYVCIVWNIIYYMHTQNRYKKFKIIIIFRVYNSGLLSRKYIK